MNMTLGAGEATHMADVFQNRSHAGKVLAEQLLHYAGRDDVVVLALPRGGVPVGYEVAQRLHAPLDVFLVRKLGVPDQEELAMGAIAMGGVSVLNDEVIRILGIGPKEIESVTQREARELTRRERAYRGNAPPLDVRGKTVILIDDGLATGSTMKAAAAALRRMNPARVVVAVPVAARSTCEEFEALVDQTVCALTPANFQAVGQWYDDFAQTTDEQVHELLSAAHAGAHHA